MSKELVIGSNRHETKVAILEEDQLVEVYFQRANEYSLAGSIHKGRVTRVLPGMQSAFVDLGLERDTFLYVSDFFEEHEDIDTVEEKPRRNDRGGRRDRESSQERRATSEVAAVEESSPRESEADEEPLVEAAPAAAAAEAVSEVRPAETAAAPNERRDNDRGGRGDRGDRRGRRSRRRRRGRDFPENKYAQAVPSAQGSAPAHDPHEHEHEDEQPEIASAEVDEPIILPGESLAKYRSRPNENLPMETGAGAAAAPVREPQQAVEPPAEPDEHTLNRAASYLGLGIERPANSEARDAEHLRVEKFLTDPNPATLPEADEDELQAAEIGTPDLEYIAPEIEEALENGIDEDATAEAFAEPEAEGAAPTAEAQSAVVREPGGRSMHRVSRRMRRRRGRSGHGGGREREQGAASPAAQPAEARAEKVVEERSAERPERAMPLITELLKPGQEIIVQIAKEPLGQKGARITSHIALPGRYVVFMPSVSHLGVSRKVSSDEERQRLKRILQTHRVGTSGGFIVRTAGEGVPEDEIAADMNFLYTLWLDIREKAEKKPAPALLHCDLDIVQRILRDQVTDDFKSIWVDSEELFESVVTFMQRFQPALVNRVKMYTRNAPIFDAFNITQELEKALRPKVWLKSGGYIVINQTEALVAIDINTGKFVGKSNRLEDTIVKTNIEAVKEIVRQIRLRDLGGIIVVDFIDMDERKNRQKVMQALEDAMREDKAPYKILQFNDFGLVAITRKRVKQSLERTLCAPCHYCEGAGYVKSVQTVIGEILAEAQKVAKAIDSKDAMLRVHPEVAKVLKAKDNRYLEELEEILGRPVLVKSDPTLHIEKFDLV